MLGVIKTAALETTAGRNKGLMLDLSKYGQILQFYLPIIFGTIYRREKRIPLVARGLWGSTTSLIGSTVSREQQLRNFRLEPHGISTENARNSEHTLLHVF